MSTHTWSSPSSRIFQSIAAVPALSAGIAVLLFVAAALLPVSVLGIFICVHAVARALQRFHRAGDSRFGDTLQATAFLGVAFSAGLFLDLLGPWSVHSSRRASLAVTLLTLFLVIAPKMQALRLLTHTAQHHLSRKAARIMLGTSALLLVLFIGLHWGKIDALQAALLRAIGVRL